MSTKCSDNAATATNNAAVATIARRDRCAHTIESSIGNRQQPEHQEVLARDDPLVHERVRHIQQRRSERREPASREQSGEAPRREPNRPHQRQQPDLSPGQSLVQAR